MSLSGEEPKTPMSLSGEEPSGTRTRAAIAIAAVLTFSGVLVGALWSWLAPPANGVVALTRAGERVHAYVGSQSEHLFIGPFLLIGFVMVVGAVAAVAAWQWRAHRGPLLLVALVAGNVGCAATAAGVGALLAHLRYGSVDLAGAPVTPEHRVHYVTEAAPVFFGQSGWQVALTLLSGAAVAALVYALAAVSNARDDLGAWPPVDPVPMPLRVDGVLPTVP